MTEQWRSGIFFLRKKKRRIVSRKIFFFLNNANTVHTMFFGHISLLVIAFFCVLLYGLCWEYCSDRCVCLFLLSGLVLFEGLELSGHGKISSCHSISANNGGERAFVSPWDDKPYEVLSSGERVYLDELDIVTFLDPPKELIPLEPASYNPAAYIWSVFVCAYCSLQSVVILDLVLALAISVWVMFRSVPFKYYILRITL